MEDDAEIKNKMLLTGLISIIGIVVVVGGIMYVAQNKLPEKYKDQEKQLLRHIIEPAEPTAAPLTGVFGMAVKGAKQSYRKGDIVTMTVTADSKGDKITGYDAVLRYDPSVLKVHNVLSLVEGMDIYQTDIPAEATGYNDLVVTGIQSISQPEPYVFAQSPLVEVSFSVLKAGNASVELVFSPNHTTDSNLMNTQTQDILSSVQGVTLQAN
ncbi:MAG: Cohesin domain protein [Microgenomates bacterium OLB23]|nr:MAG: Cohesin domain protein [Microgenomates bacterium OLB23]